MQNQLILTATEEIKQLLFIDSQIENYQDLAAGAEFIDKLHYLTGAEIAATTLTGNAAKES